jgi:hypothetical protein
VDVGRRVASQSTVGVAVASASHSMQRCKQAHVLAAAHPPFSPQVVDMTGPEPQVLRVGLGDPTPFEQL